MILILFLFLFLAVTEDLDNQVTQRNLERDEKESDDFYYKEMEIRNILG